MGIMMEPLNTVTFNGINLSDFGVYVSGDQTFSSAERDYEEVEIPGRSGSLFIDNGRFKNVSHPYDAWIGEDLETNLRRLRSFLGSSIGYCRLEDTYHPDEYYLAIFKGPLDVETILLTAGTFSLDFERKPQRFLKSGEITTEFTTEGTLNNPTLFDSKPLIRIYGYGNFMINSRSIIVLENHLDFIDIDCERMTCHCYTTNCNGLVKMNHQFPTLKPGENEITINDSTITKIEVTPRWWAI